MMGCLHISASASPSFQYKQISHPNYIVHGYVNYGLGLDENDSPVIIIYNAYEYKYESDMRTILEYIVNTEEAIILGITNEDIEYFVAEWMSHLYIRDNPEAASLFLDMSLEEVEYRTNHVDLNRLDAYSDYYQRLYYLLKILRYENCT
jgi:hypothetical protein